MSVSGPGPPNLTEVYPDLLASLSYSVLICSRACACVSGPGPPTLTEVSQPALQSFSLVIAMRAEVQLVL